MIKSRRIRYVGHVAVTGEMRYAYKVLEKNLRERDILEFLVVNGK
jgi:hypothetical protein